MQQPSFSCIIIKLVQIPSKKTQIYSRRCFYYACCNKLMKISKLQQSSMPTVLDPEKHFVLVKIAIFPLIIALSYISCIILFSGACAILLLNEGYFDVHHDKVLYLSDGIFPPFLSPSCLSLTAGA